MHGIETPFVAVGDSSVDGYAAREDAVRSGLARLATAGGGRPAAAVHLRERLPAQADWYALNEPLRCLPTYSALVVVVVADRPLGIAPTSGRR